ncbi:MAG: imidazole glycerol phosphate synthase subunit HisH [Gemmatimonadaceae bacterium]
MRVTIFDYGAGNLHSLAKALDTPGRDVRVQEDLHAALDTDILVLPGVGAFTPAAARMAGAREAARDALRGGLPCLGICLGMQLLFDDSEEGPGQGLGVVSGRVTRLRAAQVPQIGWNALDDAADSLFPGSGLRTAYYANSFVCRPHDTGAVVAWSTHESDRFAAAVRVHNVLGVQFHPEKSSAPGVAFVHQFLDRFSKGSP